MKKLLSFLLIFLSTFFFSQEYTFDYSVKINHKSLTTNDNEIDSFLFYYNNSNQNSLYNYNNGDLSLFDFDNKKKYVLKELKDELGSNEENSESGIYLSIKNKKNEVTRAQTAFDNKDRELQTHLGNKASGQSNSIRTQHNKFGDSNYNITKLNREVQLVLQPTYKSLTDDIKTHHEKLILQIKKDKLL
mgnify:CR=1 FL=1